ncbi:hypothetical protein UF75_3147 [Desulfosporosinus sp. I2]|uniref:DEAD/DEAH box helicase n=1 Tax=Desulfosporosinus sp. I2 TaxID=1617025 RepID=UPI0005EE7247|nr:DEAD/DEAH box helicase family protein [Desulfosporosinus sp. I2]KJR46482.1 hypothetical protein UF75_3147 [Desulfosporosinus sp. I2]
MELKNYQKKVLRDLSIYLSYLNETRDIKIAYKKHWESQNVRVGFSGLPIYKDSIKNTPHVCFKVPTGGGKTFLACASVKLILEAMPSTKLKMVAWLVPSNAILEQTIRTLKDVRHPYRQRLDFDFGGRVEIYTKEELLNGQNFNLSSVHEQLSVCILSYDSLRSNKKDGRKVYQENSNLAPFAKYCPTPETKLENIDDTALIQVINQLSPVVIIDESHNAQSDLSVEMLNNLNPSFVLDLTATPKSNSNIISYVDARELKKENMVKLPVIVYNRDNKQDVLVDAIQLRGNIENQTKAEEVSTGNYIRPIVLFQAQPKGKESSETFEKLKTALIGLGIPAQEIAIKTSNINEIKNVDLMDRNCPIRYIITVNALKEGWDCPFAYILATLANKTSQVDVEQILGRILRQPYAMQHNQPLLNMSYVLTSSNDFRTTLENIVVGLNKAGFSRKDFRHSSDLPETILPTTPEQNGQQIDILNAIEESNGGSPAEEFLDFDFQKVKEAMDQRLTESISQDTEIKEMLGQALKQSINYSEEMNAAEDSGLLGGELEDMKNHFKMHSRFINETKYLQIPQFFVKVEPNLFDDGSHTLLTKEALSDGFTLYDKDTQINFETTATDVMKVDIAKEGEAVPQYLKLTVTERKAFQEYFNSLLPERKIIACKDMIFQQLNKTNTVGADDLRTYINRIITGMSKDDLALLENSIPSFSLKIKRKIETLEEAYRESKFMEMIETGEITCEESYILPVSISPLNSSSSIAKSLYEAENSMNRLEYDVINAVASLDNVKWWHFIMERRGFCLNGFINHYPDFLVMTQKGTLVLIESKGEDRDNSDSAKKVRLGRVWQHQLGQKYKYFMVFRDRQFQLEGASQLDEFMSIIKSL